MNRAHITLVDKDDKNLQIRQVEYMGAPMDVESMLPYGFSSNAPLDSWGAIFNIQSSENKAGIFNSPTLRFKNLKEWEVQIGNYQTQSSIKFPEDGSIVIDAKDLLNMIIGKGYELNANGDIKLNAGTSGKIAIGNSSAELLDVCNQLLTALETTVVATSLGPQPLSSVATITALKTLLGLIKGSL